MAESKSARRIYDHAYYQAHREEQRAQKQAYYQAHREERCAYQKAYNKKPENYVPYDPERYQNEREARLAYQKSYYQRNKVRLSARGKARYAATRGKEVLHG